MLTNLWWLILHIEPPWRTAGQLDFLLYATVACAVNGTAITSKQQWCLFMFCHAWHSHACNITMCHQQILWNFWLTLTSPYQATVGQVRGIWPTAVQASSLFTSKDFFWDFYWTASTWKYLAEMHVCDIARMSAGLSIYLWAYLFRTLRQIFCARYPSTAVAWLFSGGVAIFYVLPALWITSSLHIMARNRLHDKGTYSKVIQQGAAQQIWHDSTYTNWPTRGQC